MLCQVEAVEAKPHYRPWVRFADGVERDALYREIAGIETV